jgi:hypothetical protein
MRIDHRMVGQAHLAQTDDADYHHLQHSKESASAATAMRAFCRDAGFVAVPYRTAPPTACAAEVARRTVDAAQPLFSTGDQGPAMTTVRFTPTSPDHSSEPDVDVALTATETSRICLTLTAMPIRPTSLHASPTAERRAPAFQAWTVARRHRR